MLGRLCDIHLEEFNTLIIQSVNIFLSAGRCLDWTVTIYETGHLWRKSQGADNDLAHNS